ncbi:MAG: phosphoserine phosphatase SerB [Candidatus Bathyarchaeota archaeon]|nr:MAG: phosphoserine phosphatase SerB [Candidatus Bathyarchaeota archaeon]
MNFVITATGKDKPGLIAEITDAIASANVNIVDIEAFSIRGLFAIFMIVDCRTAAIPIENLKDQLASIGNKIGLELTMEPYIAGRRKAEKKLALLTTIGKDSPGIVAKISQFLSEKKANIERIRMVTSGELNVMEISTDLSDISSNFEAFRSGLEDTCSEAGQDVVVQTEDVFQRPKRLMVFDVDSTLIEVEVIDELAKAAGVSKKVKEITRKAMNGEIDFKQALRERARLLKGLKVEVLEVIAENLEITPGAEELINTLKALGFKTALVSGGFEYFVGKIKEKLGIDYAYANKLVIREGKLTGEVEEPIIDDKRKGEIIRQLARKENLLLEEIVAVGDGANDRFMLQSSGLGIALNPKDILKKVADGVITKENLTGILYCLGAPEKRLKEIFSKRSEKETT